ncbi:hypothetical protein FIU09_04625 [Stenotrophomonas maltophilia]|nr:hypothetical protein IPC1236_30500 [Pseudomonas aeruginosa]TNY01687.1 hypothetical protein FIU09_04625 [Stenotrophomonas maltophilia]TPD80417.1 hypothetical protein FJN21_04320 [Stenotrophomonas maltophilia]TPD82403.1 hypothetical protein FJN19_12090 [Stenotrophomonas maltophilia]TPD83550.1 hypothetical protein FJN20_08510 [Stenotrophomonas maltophilia]
MGGPRVAIAHRCGLQGGVGGQSANFAPNAAAAVTKQAAASLGVKPGLELWVQVKSVALME